MSGSRLAPETLIEVGWYALGVYIFSGAVVTVLFSLGLVSNFVLLLLNFELSVIALIEARVQFLLQSYVKRDVNTPDEGTE